MTNLHAPGEANVARHVNFFRHHFLGVLGLQLLVGLGLVALISRLLVLLGRLRGVQGPVVHRQKAHVPQGGWIGWLVCEVSPVKGAARTRKRPTCARVGGCG